jgi:hypothetical protein
MVLVAALLATMGSVPHARENPVQRTEPGEGVVCAWAIYTTALEVGTRCYPGEHVDVQTELRRAVSQIDAYVIANSKPPPTQKQFDTFKREQGNVGASREFLCRGDPDQIYKGFVGWGAPAISKAVNELVSRPGQPTWGTCL